MYPLHDLSSSISWDYCSVPFKTKSMQFCIYFLVWLGVGTTVALAPFSLADHGLKIALLPVTHHAVLLDCLEQLHLSQ